MLATNLLTALALASSALAQGDLSGFSGQNQEAVITVSKRSGGQGDVTNTTIRAPMNNAFTDSDALDSVSTLSLTDAVGVPIDSIYCQAYQDEDASERAGEPFNSTAPALLSTNVVQVGSIVCTTSFIRTAPPRPGNNSTSSNDGMTTMPSMSSSSPQSSTAGPRTTSFTTMTEDPESTNEPSTRTSIVSPPEETGDDATPTDDSDNSDSDADTSDSAPSQATGENAGASLSLPAELYAGVAAAMLGLSYVL